MSDYAAYEAPGQITSVLFANDNRRKLTFIGQPGMQIFKRLFPFFFSVQSAA